MDITNIDSVKSAICGDTKILYCEAMSNPLLEISDIKKLAKLAHKTI